MIRILYVVSHLLNCGPTKQLSYIIKYLDRKKFEPHILTLSPETPNSMKEYFVEQLKVPVYSLELSQLSSLIFARKRITEYIANHNINLVHSFGFRADILVSKLEVKKITTVRNYPFHDYSMLYGTIPGFLMAKLHLYYQKKIKNVIACSEALSVMLSKHFGYRLKYIRNGIDPEKFKNLDKTKIRKKLGFDTNSKIFVFSGSLIKRKNPITIIEAFKLLNIDNVELVILGDGPIREECIKKIGNSKKIKMIGFVKNVEEYLAACDYFISASLSEGLPNSVLEALASGLPCILSDIPQHAEIANILPDAVLLFSPMKISELLMQIDKILQKDYDKLSKTARDGALKYFNAIDMSYKYQMTYEEVLSK